MRKLTIFLLVTASAIAGECPARTLKLGEALDHDCRLFRVVKQNENRYIERPVKDGWVRTEKIECDSAKLDDFGVRVYHARTVEADFYCPKEEKK